MKKLLDFAGRFAGLYNDNRLTMASAALSYHLTMTFFPLVIVLYSMLGNNYVKAMRVLAFAEHLMAEETVAAIKEFLVYVATDRSPAMLAAGVMVLLTSASAAVRAMWYSIGKMQGGTRYHGVWSILFSVVFSLLLVAGIYLVMMIMLAGRGLMSQLNRIIPIVDISRGWDSVRFLLLAGIELLLFWGIYLVSQKRGERYPTYPGAILATLAMVAVSFGFSAILGASARYPLVYGSLASLILLMMWLYFCSLVIYCGAALNIVLRDIAKDIKIT
ncbi:MAG: YihY/virulence factor BrkB family protein [Oscillospiraceae bacterium]|nr:YihY/virulence factor BrkB family protein [Oscillospiraceae bacterium]